MAHWDVVLLPCAHCPWGAGSPSAVCSPLWDQHLETHARTPTGFSGSRSGFQAVPAQGLGHKDMCFGRVRGQVLQKGVGHPFCPTYGHGDVQVAQDATTDSIGLIFISCVCKSWRELQILLLVFWGYFLQILIKMHVFFLI